MSTDTDTQPTITDPYLLDIVEAHREREEDFAAAEAERSRARKAANEKFAQRVKSNVVPAEGPSMAEAAQAIGLSRQVLYDVVRKNT